MIKDEFFVPVNGLDLSKYIKKNDIAAVHHLIRYQWAISVLKDINIKDQILDIACGAGYGSYQMALTFPDIRITGCDYDPAAINYAKRNYRSPNLDYKIGNVLEWDNTIGLNKYNLIVSFDTIEHIQHREIMMENLVNHLEENGMLLLSTPCGTMTNKLEPEWKFHRIEYSSSSLYDFISRYFDCISRPEDVDFPHLDIFDQLDGTGINYYLHMNPIICKVPKIIDNPYKE